MKFYDLKKKWDDIVAEILPPKWRKKTEPLKLKDKILIVACRNSVWANELQLKQETLLRGLHKQLREIEKIKIIS